jgi:hypothetical protein
MKHFSKNQLFVSAFIMLSLFSIIQCNNSTQNQPTEQMKIVRGKYLVTVGLCHDCHSPKIFKPDGSVIPDPDRLLSGHQAGTPLPPVDTTGIAPGKWVLGSSDFTAWVGPWGISYGANLTPDSTTGIGAWTEENFIGTIRKGKHLGQDGGRNILPPMPWDVIREMTDEDLKCVFTYLKSLRPVQNQVPVPVPVTALSQK